MALQVGEESFPPGGPGVVICTDSLSSLQLLRGASGEYLSLETEILGALTRLKRTGVDVTLQWVPAHVGIHGNEVADAFARRGAGCSPHAGPELIAVTLPLLAPDFVAALRQGAWSDWREEFGRLARERQWPSTLPPAAGTRWGTYPKAVGDCMSRLCCDRWRTIYVKVDCACGGFISFYHIIFKCTVNQNHFRPVVERLSRDSLPLTMASLVGVGGAGRGLSRGRCHVGNVLPGGSRIVIYSFISIGGWVRRGD